MKFSKLLLSVAVATSFLVGSISGVSAASKIVDPQSNLKMERFQSHALAAPSMALDAEKPVSVKVAGRHGRRVFGLVAGAIIAGAIASQYRRRGGHYNSYNRGPRQFGPRRCNKLARRCDWGKRRACNKHYNHCQRYYD